MLPSSSWSKYIVRRRRKHYTFWPYSVTNRNTIIWHLKIPVFWDATLNYWVSDIPRFERTYWIHSQSSSGSKTMLVFVHLTQLYIREDRNLQLHCCENFKILTHYWENLKCYKRFFHCKQSQCRPSKLRKVYAYFYTRRMSFIKGPDVGTYI
jgi:hypothetical protein